MAEQNDEEAAAVYEEVHVHHEARREHALMQASSEPESASRPKAAAVVQPGQRQQRQLSQQRPAIHPRDVAQRDETNPLLAQQVVGAEPEAERLYNFKGFMLYCFGVPGVSSRSCNCLLFLYYMLLFTVGVGLAILGAVALSDLQKTRPFLRTNLLVILSGLLYILAAFHGGCIWAWRANAVPLMYNLCFPLMIIIALLLSFAHVALMSAFVSVMIGYGKDIIHPEPKVEFYLLAPITLGTLVVWAIVFMIGLLPVFLLFRRRHRPRNVDQE